jgi:putative ABC transport system ATP-binding protein
MNVLELYNVHKIYDETEVRVHAVNDVSINFEEGEFAAIVGPSGSGKTTLLNLIGGLDMPSEGRILVGGTDLSTLKSSALIDFRMRNIGFVFQSYNLIPVLTAGENVEFIMSLQKWPQNERDKRTSELLGAVGLQERINSRPSKLSGGEQQRVAVARALASRPRFVLADEPTANLDSKSTANLLDIMEKLNRDENITFIFSTHDSRVVKKARRVITLEDGRVVTDKINRRKD